MEKFGKVCKEHMVKEISWHFQDYPDFFVTNFTNIGVHDMEKLRGDAKKHSSVYVVIKNAMLRRAIKESKRDFDLKEIDSFITGSCGMLFSKDDAAAVSRLLVNFCKDHETMKIQGGYVGGEMVRNDVIKRLATLPSRDVLLAMVAAGMQSPITGLVGLLHNLLQSLVGVMDAICKKKGEAGETA